MANNIEDYLKELRGCPDNLLTEKCGVYQNWAIFLDRDFGIIVSDLLNSGNYELSDKQTLEKSTKNRSLLNYKEGTVELSIVGWIPDGYTAGSPTERKKQQDSYKTCIILNPYQRKRMEGVSDMRAMAIVICNIGENILNNDLPACFLFWGDKRQPIYNQ